ncbi:MAG: hypothetical protein GXY11_04360 [Clostridiales bacterium]|nr:hypothetical protein [Clostridiales bacterium]
MDVSGNAKLAGAPVIVAEEAQGTEPLKLTSVFANTSDALVGEEIAWTATASGGEDQIAFSFFLYRDGELVSFSPVGTSSVFRMTPTEPGVYAVTAHAASGFEGANLMSGEVTVARPSGVRVTGVACDRNKAILGEPLTWTAQTEDAAGEVSYSFALYRDWALMGLYETGASPAFSIAPGEIGTYSVVGYAKDDVRCASASSAGVRIVSQALTVDSVTADQLTGVIGKPITWTVHTTGSENLHYMYFVYLNWEHVYSSDVTTQNTFTYTPTGSVNFYRYYIEGFVSDGEQTASFKSPVLPVAEEGRPRILSIVPDRAIAYPGEKITWTVAVDYGADSSDTIGQIAFWLFLDQDELAVNYTEYAQVTSYSYAPTKPGTYRLRAAIDTGFSYLVAEAPAVRVIDPTMADFAMSFDPDRLPDIALPDATPAPTLIPSRIEGPDVDFSRALATTRPPMAPDKPKSTAKPTPKPTVDLTLPNFQKQEIRLP